MDPKTVKHLANEIRKLHEERVDWCYANQDILEYRAEELRDKFIAHYLSEHVAYLEQYIAERKRGKVLTSVDALMILIHSSKDHLDQAASWKLRPVEEWGVYISPDRFLSEDVSLQEVRAFVCEAFK